MNNPTFLIVDLFCGAGGTSTGFHNAKGGMARVIACINHDPKAIKSHWLNHPEVKHFEEDIRTLDLSQLVDLVERNRTMYPDAKVILWASLECTNFSKAKGGQPRDADSRTLADHLDRYVVALDPDYVQIENVVEFMSWGPLDENGKPVSRKSGSDWLKWREHINDHGYRDEWRELNSADFGAYTSRNRLFGCFAKPELPIIWPQSTHAKKPGIDGMFGVQHKWKAVKDVLDFSDEGESIFNRKKPLVDASLERIYAGLIKFVAGGKDAFLVKYNSMAANGDRKQSVMSVDGPSPVIPCQNRLAMAFISKYYSGKPAGKVIPITGPAGTIPTTGNQSLIQCLPVEQSFLAQYYSSGGQLCSVNEPARTLGTRDTISKIQLNFLDKTFSGNGNSMQGQSIEQPAGSVLPNDKHRLINCQPFILNPSHGGHCTGTDVPCVVLIARQDKAPLYLVQLDEDPTVTIPVYDGDSEVMVRIKTFMAMYGLADIKMRMLKVSELILIQGFPKDYQLFGSQTDRKKFIGNSVVPQVVTAWCEAMGSRVKELSRAVA